MKRWARIYWLTLAVVFVLLVLWGNAFDRLNFKPVSAESMIDLLTPLFIIALFLERAQEVFVKAWRRPKREMLEREVKTAQEMMEQAGEEDQQARQAFYKAVHELSEYKAATGRRAFLLGLAGGIIISLVGVRVLHPLTDVGLLERGFQTKMFNAVDVFLTGGLLGGGSEGIHKVVALITDFFDRTREGLRQR
ncbi:hypothetical protein MYX75_02310 [Acidobacteria bacterium AH-259-A15]|nr:hypothetical protein [Acidobacteria bacterium AH-259-A15]